MPAIKYILQRFPYITPYTYVPDYYLDFAKNLLPEAIIRPFSTAEKVYENGIPGRKTSGDPSYSNLRCHMVDQAFHMLVNEHPPVEAKNYLKLNTNPISIANFNLPKKYVVVTTGFTATIREMLPEYINEVVTYIKSKGYEVVFLGKKQSSLGIHDKILEGFFKKEVDYSKGINLIDRTTLLQAGKIISKAKTIVGLDNGLLHVAGCTDVPIVGSFTSVAPEHRMPYRNNELGWNFYPVVPPESEPEKFFQSRWDFIFDYDYRNPFFYNNNLIKSVTAQLYIEQLEKIL